MLKPKKITDISSSRIYIVLVSCEFVCIYVQHNVLSWPNVKNGDNSENIKINSILKKHMNYHYKEEKKGTRKRLMQFFEGIYYVCMD